MEVTKNQSHDKAWWEPGSSVLLRKFIGVMEVLKIHIN